MKLIVGSLCVVLGAVGVLAGCVVSPELRAEAKLRELYPQVEFKSLTDGPVAGLYEVQGAESLFYFAPDRELLLFGEFFTKTGTSLTAERRQALNIVGAAKSLTSKDLDRSQVHAPAMVVRKGEPMMTAFLDIHCGACKQAVDWMTRPDVKGGLEVIFISRTKADADAAAHAVCAPEHLRGDALRQVFGYGQRPERALACDGALDLLANQARVAAEMGVEATPVFFVKDQALLGFDKPRLESLLANLE